MRPQAELPLYECAPPATEAGYGRCYAFTLDPKPTQAARNVRVVTRLCPRNECPCETCVAGDAMVRRFEGEWVAA